MMNEWLTQQSTTTDPYEIRHQDMDLLDLPEAKKQTLLKHSEQFERWIEMKWKPFVAEMMEGDELWRFRSPAQTWTNLSGRAGYAIIRDGKIIRSLVTMSS